MIITIVFISKVIKKGIEVVFIYNWDVGEKHNFKKGDAIKIEWNVDRFTPNKKPFRFGKVFHMLLNMPIIF